MLSNIVLSSVCQGGSHHDDPACLPPSNNLIPTAHASGTPQPAGAPEGFTSRYHPALIPMTFRWAQRWMVMFCLCYYAGFLTAGLSGGVATHSSNSADIKREDKDDDDENSSIADKSEEEKKDPKVSRSRTRYEPTLWCYIHLTYWRFENCVSCYLPNFAWLDTWLFLSHHKTSNKLCVMLYWHVNVFMLLNKGPSLFSKWLGLSPAHCSLSWSSPSPPLSNSHIVFRKEAFSLHVLSSVSDQGEE